MITRSLIALGTALVLTSVTGPAFAQDDKAAKGVTTRNLVTSLGGFSATATEPLFVTGSTVELPPGGQMGRHQFRVPTYVFVIDGTLTTEYEAGPVGIMGAQYHAAGQSFMDNGGWWSNYFNRSLKPVKILLLHLGYPGRPDPIVRPDAD